MSDLKFPNVLYHFRSSPKFLMSFVEADRIRQKTLDKELEEESKEHEAFIFAKDAHYKQKRRYTSEPYINHCKRVHDLVCGIQSPFIHEIICAAFLHDVVEDAAVSILEIRRKFGSKVARLVWQVTNQSKPEDGNRETRKQIDLLHLKKACPEAKTIKLADMIDNMPSIIEHDPKFAKVYMKEKRDLLEVLKEGDRGLYARAKDIIDNYFMER